MKWRVAPWACHFMPLHATSSGVKWRVAPWACHFMPLQVAWSGVKWQNRFTHLLRAQCDHQLMIQKPRSQQHMCKTHANNRTKPYAIFLIVNWQEFQAHLGILCLGSIPRLVAVTTLSIASRSWPGEMVNLRADPATIKPLEKFTFLLLGFHLRFIQVMNPRPHGTINHVAIRGSFRVYTGYKIPWPHGTSCYISARVSFKVYTNPKKRKRGKGRHAWSPQRVHFSDRFFRKVDMEHTYPKMSSTKVIKHRACAVKWAPRRRNSFRSGQTLSPARNLT